MSDLVNDPQAPAQTAPPPAYGSGATTGLDLPASTLPGTLDSTPATEVGVPAFPPGSVADLPTTSYGTPGAAGATPVPMQPLSTAPPAPLGTSPAVAGKGAVPAGGLALIGLLTLVVGAWAGIAVFVGPTFHWSPDGTTAWQWGLVHVTLHAAPGAAAVLAGLVMLVRTPKAAQGQGRSGAALAGVLAILAGAWLVLGPSLWPVIRTVSQPLFAPASPWRSFSYVAGANFGPGILLAVTGAFALAWASRSGQPRRGH